MGSVQESSFKLKPAVGFNSDPGDNTLELHALQIQPPVESSAPQEAFSNALVIRKLVSFLSPSDVLNLRRVSRLCEEEATSFLLSNEKVQQAFHIKFTLAETTLHHEHACLGTLSDFVENCWTPSRRFPVLNFAFDHAHFGKKDILEFFIICGKDLRSLSLDPSPNVAECPIPILNFILFEWAPNLKNLSLVSTPWPLNVRLVEDERTWKKYLPLENLSLHGHGTGTGSTSACSHGVVWDILRFSPNLRRIWDPELKFTQLLTAAGRFGLLETKLFQWNFHRDTNPRFSAFVQARPLLIQELQVDLRAVNVSQDDFPEIGNALSNLFEGCRTTLEKISRLPILHGIPNVQLPVMEKVTEALFHMNLGWSARSGILPPGQTLKQVFPQLKHLELHQLQELPAADLLFEDLQGQPHEGVTKLVLASYELCTIQPIWVKKAATAFPKLTVFTVAVKNLETLPAICRIIWSHMVNLEQLDFEIMYSDNTSGSKLAEEMDSVFTGFPVKLCQWLHRKREEVANGELENLDHLRQFPSILNLSKLKTLTINWFVPMWRFQPLFTSVASRWALQPMIQRQQLSANFVGMPNVQYGLQDGVYGVETFRQWFPIIS